MGDRVNFAIRQHDCTGALLGVIAVAEGRVQSAAALGAALSRTRRAYGPPTNDAYGVHRETGVPTGSGVFSLRRGGAYMGQIHVRHATDAELAEALRNAVVDAPYQRQLAEDAAARQRGSDAADRIMGRA